VAATELAEFERGFFEVLSQFSSSHDKVKE
jgi:hypothetical protein